MNKKPPQRVELPHFLRISLATPPPHHPRSAGSGGKILSFPGPNRPRGCWPRRWDERRIESSGSDKRI